MTAMKTSLKATLIATAIAALPVGSYAAGLGPINVFSGLGQPLRAEIELQATPQELETLSARVASVGVFQQANVSYSPVMSGLQFSVESRGDRSVVKVTSNRPVHEPFLDLLVELHWANGRLMREYTFLLDPVDLAPSTMVAAPRAAPAVLAAAEAPRAAAPQVARAPAGEYRVQRGDTLRAIANRHRPPGTSLDQMLIALLHRNPAAFDDQNINRLRAGAILTIPDQATVQSVESSQARREIVAQAADFEAYRNRLAGAVAARPAAAEPAVSRESAGEIAPRVAEAPPPDVPQDRVEVSGASGEPADTAHLARLQALEEELVARERSLEEANSRLAELEQSIRDLQQLVELRNQSLARLQQQLMADAGQASTPADVLPSAQDLLAEAPAEAAVTESGMLIAETGSPEAPLIETFEAAKAVEAVDVVEAPAVAVQAPEAPSDAQPPVRSEPPPMPAQPTFLQTLLDDPKMLAGGGGILALLLGYAGYTVRRRRHPDSGDESLTELSEFPSEAKSVVGSKGGQSVDTTSSSVLHTDFSQTGLSAIDADEGVDPVAEADVYIAYGRDAQAEEILLDALKADASRSAIYLKLLEIYAQRKTPRQFEAVATDLYSRTSGQGEDWGKAAEMGRKLDPDNPLYGGNSAETLPPSSAPEAGRAGGATAAVAGLAGAAVAGAAMAIPKDEARGEDDVSANALDDLDFSVSSPVQPTPSQFKDTWTLPGGVETLTGEDDKQAEEIEPETADEPAVGATDTSARIPDVDFSVLDFDLGTDAYAPANTPLGAESAPAKASPGEFEPTAASIPAAEDELTLDFDIDADPETAMTTGMRDGGEGSVDDDGFEKTLVGEAFSDERVEDPEAKASSDELSIDVEGASEWSQDAASGSSDIDLSATVVQSDEDVAEDDASVTDLEQTTFDNQLLDFDFDLDGGGTEARGEAPALDLSSIDLELDAADEDGGEAPETGSSPAPDVVLEVDTKLDLARAYEEMGDKEGARELIEEVLREGSVAQREAAGRLLEQLG